MGVGVQFYDGSGNLQIGEDDRYVQLLGAVTITAGNQSGSVVDADFALGEPWYVADGGAGADPTIEPVITFAGTTMSWAENTIKAGDWLGTILYGTR